MEEVLSSLDWAPTVSLKLWWGDTGTRASETICAMGGWKA
jgi:hypothetical protein